MDSRRAQAALDEVQTRRRQVTETALRESSPWWCVGGLSAVFLVIAVSDDLDGRFTGWVHDVVNYGVPVVGLLIICGLMLALYRSTRVRVRRYPRRVLGVTLGLAVALLGVYIGLGTLLRAYDVAWDHTISGAAAVLVYLAGYAVYARSVAARSGSTREQ